MTEPKFIVTDRMQELCALMEPLEEKYDALRGKYMSPLTEESRALCKEIAKLGKEYWDISLEVNKEWHNQPPLWKNKFTK